MNNCTMKIWGRVLDIAIVFDCYSDEKVLESQKLACNMFIEKASSLLDAALPKVKQYCLEVNRHEIPEDKIANIFKYVKPKTLFIKRTTESIRKVAVICAYKFNPDDGLAIVFENEEISDIGTENIII